jgi:catechol 2,3-dioxygenase-like lactoylglutathione lyase family enzyme
MKLAAVRIAVRDLDAAVGFYAQPLGLRVEADGRDDGYCVFDAGGVDLVVEAVPAHAPADEQSLVGRFTGISFAVDDLAATHARLTAAGVRFAAAPQLQSWGGHLATLADADGNLLQLVQYPSA